ncbi:uncharacterized protein MYCGRDRAFT_33249 [Zymoseptoria tritici IPO323]|uniref:Uncharacterized protein n=1 Tax=Zymoseptoria tritici (strain CBS 115943 / IPO323) TaxID=336722 RepID=F9WWQ6_ZYMTI|nr:uncharacterized protein MYCGRDRAFT_33249 [Zymoseptoria tritici IPO323]EGP91467.1 hypothetical protein MYCGRDRAFT_33249 [Zymoseptoria tritici IPO323]
MSVSTHPPDWLRRYGNLQGYSWRPTTINGRSAFCRPLGLVEFSFDTDGRHYEGRADMNVCIKTELATTLSKADLRERILLAWTRLRNQHLLLRAKTIRDESDSLAPQGLHFAVTVPESWQQARIEDEKQIVWLEDHYENIEWKDFYHHCQNIWDGLSSYVWMRDFVHCLNETSSNLQDEITTYIQPESIRQRLPLPQEALYPPIPGNVARQRWFWAITRILRHVRTPLPAGFENPLRQEGGVRKQAIRFEQKYAAVLDYSAVPPLNTTTLHVAIPSSRYSRRQSSFIPARQLTSVFHTQRKASLRPLQIHFHNPRRWNLRPRRPNHDGGPRKLLLLFFLPSGQTLHNRLSPQPARFFQPPHRPK